MNDTLRLALILGTLSAIAACSEHSPDPVFGTKAKLGKALFSDTNLSLNRTQSCATCHSPDHAFIDPRLDGGDRVAAVSTGDDGFSLGTRNSPTAAYAMFAPGFEVNGTRQRPSRHSTTNIYSGALGGQFLDGRENDLEGQAAQPPLNPVEMNMPDRASVVIRLEENDDYIAGFKAIYGSTVFDDTDTAYQAMADAIAEFERTDEFAPFDSKYDRSLTGDYDLTFKELTGRDLFFSANSNCGLCHQLHSSTDFVNRNRETFSGYEYHNIGVPAHPTLGLPIDNGLNSNLLINDATQDGKFKVATLRNVAVTGPYMHNGVFSNLATVVRFYDFMNNGDPLNNPETPGIPWAAAETAVNIATAELAVGKNFSDFEVEALVCFMRLLTDKKFEHFIETQGIDCL